MKIVAAMCDKSRGIGMSNGIPWPYLPGDDIYYRTLVAPKHQDQRTANIKGRLTWISTKEDESKAPGVINIVITSKPKESLIPTNVHYTCSSLEDAHQYALDCNIAEDDMWIMGGHDVYKAAIEHPFCSYLHLTRLFAEFETDTSFPPFEHQFKLTKDPEVHKENGIKYQFEVYERMKTYQ
ncbi:hypothetical protein SNE40_000952 [Patella caerulea]|uniref:dihydrofolate reductase n=1 Tax=Patella caerulea TaxID=87958 RepID=A0AAN8KMK5_PATCE